ncbi:glycosyltransferase [Thiohalocapsa marina]|uniref:Glycosyltransferase n=1 Tax=Thiohalocapsa marina TaxID=424902 RepID=A0A5M8FUC7_9GAMM|nr:glycosyltransferase [Thiohalocapsa marina]KAA6187395.1 glycosyltransferase [Thiohalocapsa marina]
MSNKRAFPFLVSPYSLTQRLVLAGLTACWFGALVSFYAWWFDPAHVVTEGGFWAITLVFFWDTLTSAYFLFFISRARIPDTRQAPADGWRVAMVVTKAPGEPFAMVQETLRGMLAQDYRHDTWLADERPDAVTIRWCAFNGVKISSRDAVAEYHRPDWPRRTGCKEGNLAYFYDHFGYDTYDFVVQLDADHVPQPGYLEAMLRPFLDARVGYVSAPSICDRNAGHSWPARARLYAEAHLHGLQQAGHANGFVPLCFGSHYAIRTAALKAVGGLGPELAEDHSTTLMLNAAGWRGVHAFSATAHGHGPRCFRDFAVQEFQWARSLMNILLGHLPRHWRGLSPSHRLQFAYTELWYLLSSVSMLVVLLLPAIALFSSTPLVTVSFAQFLWRLGLIILPLLLLYRYLCRQGFARPPSARCLGWEALLYLILRWPWSLLGSVAGIGDRLFRRRWVFEVTPKPGTPSAAGSPARLAMPYLACSLFAILPVFLLHPADDMVGYVFFSALNAIIYALTFSVVAFLPPAARAPAASINDAASCPTDE